MDEAARRRLVRLAERVATDHGAHTAILYGSYARGDANPLSDVDLLVVRAMGPARRDARLLDGLLLDAFVESEATFASPDVEQLKLAPGHVLFEQDGFGTTLLDKVRALEARGPSPLPDDERQMRRVWARKSLDRARERSPEADYRRHYLLVQSLEDYFALRTRWFRGSKESLEQLAREEPGIHLAFCRALQREASDEDLARLIELVYEAQQGPSGSSQFAGPQPEG
jgi:uncharacterized protein